MGSDPKSPYQRRISSKDLIGFCFISEENQREGLFGVNDPTAGSPTVTLLRLLLPLSDKVYLTSLIAEQFSPESLPDHSKSVGATGGVYKSRGRNRDQIMTDPY